MITRESEAAFWNEPSMVQYFAVKDPDPRVVERIDALGVSAKTSALDLGCGGGRHTEALVQRDALTTAIDVNPAMLENTLRRTKEFDERVTISPGSIGHIPAEDDAFDVVVSTGVLHQARNLEELEDAVRDVRDKSRKGGIFVGNMFVSDIWDSTYTIPNPQHPEYVETAEHVGMTLITADQAIGIFQANGFVFEVEPVVDFKQENTGPRGVLRFCLEQRGK